MKKTFNQRRLRAPNERYTLSTDAVRTKNHPRTSLETTGSRATDTVVYGFTMSYSRLTSTSATGPTACGVILFIT